ncbi:MAG: MBL fold metallo-hydrolase [Methanomassiliicoccaceae archaeon]|jgi:7,8-dihydropterin-6-yl-methyl-4-(beta-D-ribofuranosyl)aminobenzene 5'-phosphate synthase|nr:MBL fold metallo-hydrolase [Methanomassiliicoccaceae archaeon]
MKAKLLCVYDEGALPETPLIGAKGLSILADVDGQRTLFGTGMRGRYFTHNSEYLNIDVNGIDRIILSHMHKEHTGGLPALLEMRDGIVDVLIPPEAADAKRTKFLGIPIGKEGMPGLSEELTAKMATQTVSGWTRLSENLFITSPLPDTGPAEISLVVMTKNGPVLVCGCCHQGAERLIGYVEETTKKKVHAIVGGIHLTDKKKKEVHKVAEMLKEKGNPQLYLNHCSGHVQRTQLREVLGLKAVNEFYVGTEIQFEI